MVRDEIIKKAYQCIDEVYPDTTYQDISSFNVDAFLDQAAKIIINTAPLRVLSSEDIRMSVTQVGYDNGVIRLLMPTNFQRLVSFKMEDWAHSITNFLDEDSPRYHQQSNPVLRGTPSRPAAFITSGGQLIEVYTTNANTSSSNKGIAHFYAILFDTVDDTYPQKLHDVTAWKTAELVLSALNDTQAAQICQAHTQEILQSL